MAATLEVTFRNMKPSEFVEGAVRDKLAHLEELCDSITSCHVILDSPHRHQRTGRLFEVNIELRVPGTELAVGRATGQSDAHDDMHVALRDAFGALEKQLKRWKEKRRGDVKAHMRSDKSEFFDNDAP